MNTPRRSIEARIALAAGVALALSACGNGDLFGVHQGRVRFVLSADQIVTAADRSDEMSTSLRGTDGTTTAFDGGENHQGEDHPGIPGGFFQSANVTFSSILARNTDGVLIDVAMDLPVTVDVVAMEEAGRQIVLPDGELPPGEYDQLVVVITAVQGVTRDGTTITAEPPGGGWTSIVPVCPFEVADGETAVVGLTLNVRQSFQRHFQGFHFAPRFFQRRDACVDDEPDEEGGVG